MATVRSAIAFRRVIAEPEVMCFSLRLSQSRRHASCLVALRRQGGCHGSHRAVAVPGLLSSQRRSRSTAQAEAEVKAAAPPGDWLSWDAAQPFNAIPGPLALPVIGNLYEVPFTTLTYKNMNDLARKRFRKYGAIYREKMGPYTLVHLSDVAAIEHMHRLDGRYPRRMTIGPWKVWRQENGLETGILIEDGERWKRMRQVLDKQMLPPKQVATYAADFNDVNTDFLRRLRHIRDPDTCGIPNLDQELFHWSLESIGAVLYETRLGCLADDRQRYVEDFVQAVHNVFRATGYIFGLSKKMSLRLIPKWQNMHDDAWQTIFTVGQDLISRRISEMERELSAAEPVRGFLSTLIASSQMSLGEVYGNISELMAAAVDTTSNTMQWVLMELAQNPDVQEKIRQEVTSELGGSRLATHEDLQRMPYLKSFLKEILRLYPVGGVDTRILNTDMVLCGYQLPKNSRVIGNTFVMGRNPAVYEDPDCLRPERWLRTDLNRTPHSFAWLPFGFGTRMCIGRRVAELELQLLLTRIVQEFVVENRDPEANLPVTRPLLVPERPVNVGLVDL